MSEAGQHERKLFSAVTGSDIAGAARLGCNALRYFREDFVSCRMAVGIIEKLEEARAVLLMIALLDTEITRRALPHRVVLVRR